MTDFSKNDFSKAKVGDRVWHFSFGWGEVKNISKEMGVLVSFDSEPFENCTWFLFDGRFTCNDVLPSLFWNEIQFEIPPMPKRKVKKTIERWINIYSHGKAGDYCHKTKESAEQGATSEGAIQVKLTGEYEVEEGE